jgi:6-phosphogluconolactonase
MIFYTGSYTIKEGSPASNPKGKGIGCFEFNHNDGGIKLLGYTNQRSPSYVAISKDKKFLYAAEECSEHLNPKVFAYKIGYEGKLSMLNFRKLKGGYSCHLALINNQLIVANYSSGNASIYTINKDGGLSELKQIIQHTGYGKNPVRQKEPHIHMVYPVSDNKFLLVDLGLDKIKAYEINKDGDWCSVENEDFTIPLGAGARHMSLGQDDSLAYVLGELSCKIYVFKNSGNGFKLIQSASFLPRGYLGKISGAALRIHPNGRFLYASERESNSIAVFKIDENTGKIGLLKVVSTRGKTPRDFNVDPEGKWLLVANQDTNSINTFRIDSDSTLEYLSELHVYTPSNITILD